jgi:hypothetical protein
MFPRVTVATGSKRLLPGRHLNRGLVLLSSSLNLPQGDMAEFGARPAAQF